MNTPQRFWNTAITALGILVAFLAVLTIKEIKAIGYVGKSSETVSMITVDGTGSEIAKPDVATFSFGVSENAATVADAQAKATARINTALKAVRDGGVAENDIQTTSYSINPHYDYQSSICTTGYCNPGKQVLNGYDVSQNIEVKVRDLTKAGALLSSIGSVGVQNVSGLSFQVDEPDTVQASARAKAITDARTKAVALAKQLGVTLGDIVSFSDTGNMPRPIMYSATMDMAVKAQANPAPEIPSGEQKVTSNVSITYEIR